MSTDTTKNNNNAYSIEATLRCDAYSGTLVFSKNGFANTDIHFYEISIEDSYTRNDFSGIVGRFKRAWHAFFGHPIVYSTIMTKDESKLTDFFDKCNDIIHTNQ